MMNWQNYIDSLLKIAVRLSPTLIILSTFSLPSLAQPLPSRQLPTTTNPNKPQQTSRPVSRIQFPSAADRGTPQRTGAGGRRGNSCTITDNQQPSLTALMPTWDNQGQTVTDNPILYVYVPKTKTKTGEFVVLDDQGNEVYQANFTLPSQPGIVQLTIPASASIKIGKTYQWYFTLICNREDRSQDEYVSGSLERTTLGSLLNSSLEQAAPLKQAEIYAKKKIWYDTIRNVAAVRTDNPDVWTDLLKSVGLENFATEPFVDLGKPQP